MGLKGVLSWVKCTHPCLETSPNFIMYKSWPKDHFKRAYLAWHGHSLSDRSMFFVNCSDVLQKAMVGSEKNEPHVALFDQEIEIFWSKLT